MTVLVFHSRYDKKLALVGTIFDTRHALQGSVFVFRQEQDEAQRVAGVRQQTVDVLKSRVDEFFAVWWIRLERASGWEKVQERSGMKKNHYRLSFKNFQASLPSRSEIRVSIAESRAVLTKVAVERTREALEGDAEVNIETIKYRGWNRGLRLFGFLLHG